ncbi:MAG: hypothetical protein ACFUZC_11490 [Chthoniobacteraceae bacterium]
MMSCPVDSVQEPKTSLEVFLARVAKGAAAVAWDAGFARQNERGHTVEVTHLPFCHEGRGTAIWYSILTLMGGLTPAHGLEIIEAIGSLQVRDKNSPHYGGFRWYREETEVHDTNAAFFILMPLVVMMRYRSAMIPEPQRAIIARMLQSATDWFAGECEHPALYYPNKILSDGAMLIAIATLTHNEEARAKAIAFFLRWNDYTDRRGWGWGENASLNYLAVILCALKLAADCLDARDAELRQTMEARIATLLDYVRFHDGQEFVPTIRSYNFQGNPTRTSLVNNIAGIAGNGLAEIENLNSWDALNALLLFEQRIFTNDADYRRRGLGNRQVVPRTRIEHIFDKSSAHTWIGRFARIGSIDRFPVMPGSYQNRTWGLGWQSFPVSFLVEGEQVSFLRWHVIHNGIARTHPAEGFHDAYLSSSLFAEDQCPEVETRCNQSGNILACIRSMTGISNRVSEIADEWFIQRFSGSVHEHVANPEGDARPWIILDFGKAAVAVTGLLGLTANDDRRKPARIVVQREKECLKLRQVLFEGEEQVVCKERIEAAWLVVLLDEPGSSAPQDFLPRLTISERSLADGEVPRNASGEIREITVAIDGEFRLGMRTDPHFKQVE